jgi:hypothetical protein
MGVGVGVRAGVGVNSGSGRGQRSEARLAGSGIREECLASWWLTWRFGERMVSWWALPGALENFRGDFASWWKTEIYGADGQLVGSASWWMTSRWVASWWMTSRWVASWSGGLGRF